MKETYKLGKTTFTRITTSYDQAIKQLEREGTLKENAQLRIQEGKDSKISRYGNWVKEDILYIPKKGVFLTKEPVISQFPEQATNAHRSGKEFYITGEQAEKSLENSVQLPYTLESIPTNRFNDDERTQFAFEAVAQEYGEFLREVGIKEMPIWLTDKNYVDEQDKSFARKLWFHVLGDESLLYGDFRGLHRLYYRLFGIQKSSEATQKILQRK